MHRTSRGCKTLGLCSQRSTFLVWEQSTGQPLTALISWQDNRGAASCAALRMHGDVIRNISGLPLTQYYFAAKLRVLLQDNPGWQPRLESDELSVGTLDSFLIWRLTGGRHFLTDASMAARTQLMDIRQQRWSTQLCKLFDIPPGVLSEIKASVGMGLQLNNGLVLQSSVGDQSAALFASIRQHRPEALVNLGTGCFVIRYLPDGEMASHGYLQTLVYQDSEQHAHSASEGTLNSIAVALAPHPVSVCSVDDLAVDDIYCVADPAVWAHRIFEAISVSDIPNRPHTCRNGALPRCCSKPPFSEWHEYWRNITTPLPSSGYFFPADCRN